MNQESLLSSFDPENEIVYVPHTFDVVTIDHIDENIFNEYESIFEEINNLDAEPPVNYISNVCDSCGVECDQIEDSFNGYSSCGNCGVVTAILLDQGPDWRSFSNEDGPDNKNNRCAGPTGYFPSAAQGSLIGGPNSSKYNYKQNWLANIHREKSLAKMFLQIDEICALNGLSRAITDTTKMLYKEFTDYKHPTGKTAGSHIIIRKQSIIGVVAACVFKSCERNYETRLVQEIAIMFKISKSKVTMGKKKLETVLRNSPDYVMNRRPANETAEDYIKRHCNKIIKDPNAVKIAIQITRNCRKLKLDCGHNPQSIAAGAVLMMLCYYKIAVSSKDIATIFGTTNATISKIYAKIMPYIKALVNDEVTDHLVKHFGL